MTFGTVRALRSAMSQFYKIEWQLAYPGSVIQDRAKRTIAVRSTIPTDDLSCTLMHAGMASRIGEDSIPSEALSHAHIEHLDSYLEELYNRTSDHT